ncbi:hypothetical protein Bca4012_072805 [Brassica carinata]
MREDGKTGKNRSRKNTKVNLKEPVTDAVNADYVADIVRKSVSAELCKMGEQIKNLSDNGITAEKGVVEETNDDDADVNLESEQNADVLSDIDAPAVETNPHLQDSADGRSDIDDPAVKNNPHLQDSADVLPDTNAPAVETNPHLQDSLTKC